MSAEPMAHPLTSRAAALLAAVLTSWSASSAAYVCTRTHNTPGEESGPSLSWFERDLTFCLHADGTEDIAGDLELDVIRSSFGAWGTVFPAAGGSFGTPPSETVSPFRQVDLTFTECAAPSETAAVGFNYLDAAANENLIIFQDGEWPHGGASDDQTLALTTNTFNALTGEILDADIEFNTANMAFAVLPANGGQPGHDLANTAVHEIGHFVGLAHSAIGVATMWGDAQEGETSKRSLFDDDANGVVFKYPGGAPNGYCEPTPACSCAPPDELENDVDIHAANGSLSEGGCGQVAVTGGGHAAALVLLGAVALLRSAIRKQCGEESQFDKMDRM